MNNREETVDLALGIMQTIVTLTPLAARLVEAIREGTVPSDGDLQLARAVRDLSIARLEATK